MPSEDRPQTASAIMVQTGMFVREFAGPGGMGQKLRTLKMAEERHRVRRVLKAFVRLDEIGTIKRKGGSRYDATRPSFLIVATIAYAAAVFFIIIGVPLRGVSTEPIPKEDLPYAIPIFILVYIVIVGGLYLQDRFRKKP